jgi:isopentenyldiphosphate isomerase
LSSPMNESEMLVVVDEDDQVVGQASREEIHAKGLWHRSAHVLVVNGEGQVLLQQRSMKKDLNPGRWTSSTSGHVDAADASYEVAARREFEEELGLPAEGKLRPVGKALEVSSTANITCRCRAMIYEWPTDLPAEAFAFDREEIDQVAYFELERIRQALDGRQPLLHNGQVVELADSFAAVFEVYWAYRQHKAGGFSL